MVRDLILLIFLVLAGAVSCRGEDSGPSIPVSQSESPIARVYVHGGWPDGPGNTL